MKRTILAVRAATAIALLAIAASGCAKKVTSVDSNYTQVEGVPNPEVQLVVWPDLANTLTDYARETVPNTTPVEINDVILGVEPIYAVGANAQRLAVLDGSTAGAFQLFRRENGGGFRQFQTFPLQASRRWLDTHSEFYSANDLTGSGFAPPTYVARGLVEGVATTASPLSNVALSNVVPARTIVYRGAAEPTDSLFRMSWSERGGPRAMRCR